MSQLTDRIERDLREIAAGARPSPSAWKSIVARLGDDRESEMAVVLAPDSAGSRRAVWTAMAAAALVVFVGSVAVLVTRGGDDHTISTADPVVTTIPPSAAPFVGIWVSTDTDGSSQTMEIVRSGGDEYEFVLRDDFATTCSGAAATMTGTGLLVTDERLVIAQPELTCDDATVPRIGPPPQAELVGFTLELDTGADEFVDSFGVVWRREGAIDEPIAPSPVTVPALAPGTSGGMWPQTTLDEVRAAQELADAGDPAATWQLDATLAADGEPWTAKIFSRFIEDELGWEEFSVGQRGYASGGGVYDEVVFIRCAPGATNPLNPLYQDAPPDIRRCAPTIDELTYETVGLSVAQPERRGASGIWVVDRWEILQPKSAGSLFGLLYADFASRQVEQVVPPSEAEVTAVLQAFLGARVDGEGAEQSLLREPEGSPFEDTEVPLLYAATSGARYERFEIEQVQGPVWPTGWTEYQVRLFTDDETVVEQHFHVVSQDGQLGLVYGYASNGAETTENGQSVAAPRNAFGGTLSFTSPPLVPRGDGTIEIALTTSNDGRVIISEDPLPERQGCWNGPSPPAAIDATALARSIEADADFETTEPVPVTIAGVDGLQMDVTFGEHDLCYGLWSPERIPGDDSARRMRLYLVEYPESARQSGSDWRPQVLTIAVIAPETDFERALEESTPIVQSLEFHPA